MITSRFQKSSQRLVHRFGTERTYKKLNTGSGSYNVDTQTYSASSTDYVIKTHKVKATDSETKSPSLVDKDVAVILIAGADINFVPNQGDVITDLQGSLTVFTVKEHWAGDAVSLWRLICVKG